MNLKTEEDHRHKLESINTMHIAQLEDACIDISILRDKYESELTEAYAVADAQMAKAIAAEETLFSAFPCCDSLDEKEYPQQLWLLPFEHLQLHTLM